MTTTELSTYGPELTDAELDSLSGGRWALVRITFYSDGCVEYTYVWV